MVGGAEHDEIWLDVECERSRHWQLPKRTRFF